jgi:hypothetical protein
MAEKRVGEAGDDTEAMEFEHLSPCSSLISFTNLVSSPKTHHRPQLPSLQSFYLLLLEVERSSIIIKSIDNYSVATVTLMHDASSAARSDNN